MKPYSFKEANVVYSDTKKEKIPQPALRINEFVVVRWKASIWERIQILFLGSVWIQYITKNGELPNSMLLTRKGQCFKKSKK